MYHRACYGIHALVVCISSTSWLTRCLLLAPGVERKQSRSPVNLCRHILRSLKHGNSIVEAAGSYNAALDLIHTALRAESEGERYTGVLSRLTLAFALRV
jgi:hypothetical protein